METEQAFILINTVKCIGDEYKAVTQSGTEIYVKKDELIPYVRFPEGPDESFGFVKVNGKAFTADTVKIIIQIYEGLIRRFEHETDKENLKRLQDAEIGKSQRKQSNADRIRSMTGEELAEIIMCQYDTDPSVCNYKGVCLDCCLKWLKSPVEE
mgnify:CR=1 FL=1